MEANTVIDGQAAKGSASGAGPGAGSGTQRDAHARQRPQMKGYMGLIALYNGAVALALALAKRSGRLERARLGLDDLLLAGVATQRLSRLVTKDRVTSAIRAPFTEYQGEAGPGEVDERAQGHGFKRALGELVTCPFCVAQWIAAAFACGLLFAPKATRWLAGMFSVVALADVLQLLYKRAEELTTKG